MTKQMENNVDNFKPMKEADYEKLTPAQKKAYDAKAKKAMMGNLPEMKGKPRRAEKPKGYSLGKIVRGNGIARQGVRPAKMR
tara:strand:+ start:585 stop:830 length:246 start_codon:yes stop_codon:yes gene_type:complete